MDRTIVEEKLEALRHCVERIRSKCPEDVEQLTQSADLQDIIAMNLARAVQLSVDVAAHILAHGDVPAPTTMAESFEALRAQGVVDEEVAGNMKRAVGFRNIAVHAYEKINWAVVHHVCRHRLVDFERFAGAVSQVLDRA